MVEIGIGGAGPHIVYRECLDPKIPVIGVDRITPGNFKTPKEKQNYESVMNNTPRDNLHFYWGMSGYDFGVSETLAQTWGKFGIVIDDGSPTYGSLYGINGWKQFMDASGIIISEHPFGNGVTLPWNIYQDKQECQYALEYSSELNEMVIIDCHDFMYNVPNTSNSSFDFPIPYMGIWMKDWDSFRKHKTNAGVKTAWRLFEERIVAGRQYYDA